MNNIEKTMRKRSSRKERWSSLEENVEGSLKAMGTADRLGNVGGELEGNQDPRSSTNEPRHPSLQAQTKTLDLELFEDP